MSFKRMSIAALGLVALVVVVMAAWRLSLIALGPDPDGDAYGHYVISRSLMDAPLKHGKHWVWLPVFHWLQLPLLYVGGTMDTIRQINVAVWAFMPPLLCAYVLKTRASSAVGLSDTTPLRATLVAAAAGVLLALTPLGMQMGTTAQPEPLFALLALCFAWLMQQRRFAWAALPLSVMVLLRYEAWAVWAFTCVALLWQERRVWLTGDDPGRVRWLSVLVMAAPLLSVLGWAVLRYPHDGDRWFAFIGGTHDFVTGALRQKSSFEQGIEVLAYDSIRYLWLVPYRTFGFATLLVVPGFWITLQRHRWLSVACAGVLAFITLSWLTRSTLGLERHFVAVLAWYATMMAYGAEVVVRHASRLLGRVTTAARRFQDFALVPLLGVLVAIVWARTDEWMGHWRHAIEHIYADQVQVARYLDALPADQVIACDEPTVEGLTKLRFDRVARVNIDAPESRERIAELLESQGVLHVASWLGKLRRLPHDKEVVFEPPLTAAGGIPGEGHPDKQPGLAVMRLTP